ncbi:hypothetical protein GCE86_30665 [Micromonospora terminaliae]|uniref:PH domain-containing protein n=1 Tax=Micromonospora terminaliae TaxID=1914461 RepID=A0AAJ2ZBW0_9ACTN|nr:hypothetical protein [Micromonospora terminaliae]NES26865.1 hypothetical protein [Micromonospora terminaliae]QGL51016.1 hypothetical protein GCE86_30665 [Micromonospora terminaliae]
MTNDRIRLSVGAASGQRAGAAVVGVLFTAFGAAFVLLPLVAEGLLRRVTGFGDPVPSYDDVRDLPPDLLPPDLNDAPAAPTPLRFAGLCGLPFVLLGLYLVLRVLRTATWLDGTRASVRGALGTRTVDLATADVRGGAVAHRVGDDGVVRVPTLIARDRETGRRVSIPLQGPGLGTLPPYELRALAEAITAGRPDQGRDADAHVLAGRLRTMAEDPLGR